MLRPLVLVERRPDDHDDAVVAEPLGAGQESCVVGTGRLGAVEGDLLLLCFRELARSEQRVVEQRSR